MTPFIVSLTDFLITALCMVFCWKLWTQPADKKKLNYNFFGLFCSIGIAALLGGIVHIYGEIKGDVLNVLWMLTIINVGISSYNLWIVNMRLMLPDSLFRYGSLIGRSFFGLYVLFVLFINHEYYVAIVSYIPAAALLFFILLMRSIRERNRYYLFGLGGLLLTFVAAVIQHYRLEVVALYLDHNSLYHIVQAVGLWGLYLFGSRVSRWNI